MLQHTGNTWLNFRTSFVNTFEFWQPDHKTRPKSWIILKMCHRNFLDDTTQLNNEKITLWRKDTIKSSKASLTWAQGKGKNQFICFVLFWASWNSEPWFPRADLQKPARGIVLWNDFSPGAMRNHLSCAPRSPGSTRTQSELPSFPGELLLVEIKVQAAIKEEHKLLLCWS